ncbi:hypothetical protein N7456_010973 [Penicillium angulare]|uniref:Uracil-DNA glycosylase-like domain-containing protein n=1 Tax=Penicillium angulare TaxID=116970 RepID=A0A9W9ESS6_9EURO|nr:hypothetical protein N7456_010973 [Penicillium angulare]
MSSSSHGHTQSQTDCISDKELEDMPINKATSFHGRLDKFINPAITSNHQPHNHPLPSHEATMNDNDDAVFDPRRNNKPKLPIKSSIQTRRITRSYTASLSQTPSLSPTTSLPQTSPLPQTPSLPPTPTPSLPPTPTGTRSPGPIRRAKRRPITSSDTPPPSTCRLRDTIPPNLILLLVGVNPGLKTGHTGYAYAHPTNLFWRLLHSSGITSIRHLPSDTYNLPNLYGVGNTNIVFRATRDASMLSKAEMDEGVPILESKIAEKRPEAVCLVGKGIWEAVFRVRYGRAMKKDEFEYGWQDPSENMGRCGVSSGWGGARVFVATTTSGVAAGMSPREKEEIWAELGAWVVKRRAERGVGGDSGA